MDALHLMATYAVSLDKFSLNPNIEGSYPFYFSHGARESSPTELQIDQLILSAEKAGLERFFTKRIMFEHLFCFFAHAAEEFVKNYIKENPEKLDYENVRTNGIIIDGDVSIMGIMGASVETVEEFLEKSEKFIEEFS